MKSGPVHTSIQDDDGDANDEEEVKFQDKIIYIPKVDR